MSSDTPSQNPSSSSLPSHISQTNDPSDAFSGVTLANITESNSGTSSLTKTQWMNSRSRGSTNSKLEVEME